MNSLRAGRGITVIETVMEIRSRLFGSFFLRVGIFRFGLGRIWYRRLDMKGNDAASAISITLFFKHLKCIHFQLVFRVQNNATRPIFSLAQYGLIGHIIWLKSCDSYYMTHIIGVISYGPFYGWSWIIFLVKSFF